MKKLAFLVNHLGPNQTSLLLCNNINKFLQKNSSVDVMVFCDSIFPNSFKADFCILPFSDLMGYNGACVSLGFHMGKKLLATSSVRKKIHFAFDFDWSLGLYNVEEINELYKSNDILFAVRNEIYAKQFTNLWNKNPYIFGEIDVRKISEVI